MKGKIIIRGIGAAKGVAVGRVRVVNSDMGKMAQIQPGEIVVGEKFVPAHDKYIKQGAAFIQNVGGRTSHIVLQYGGMGKPVIVGTRGTKPDYENATELLKTGQPVIVDGNEGAVYEYVGPPLPEAPKMPPTPVKPAPEVKELELAEQKGIDLDVEFQEKLKRRLMRGD